METVYRIAKWRETFETAESKRHVALRWISLPITINTNGYQSLVTEFGDDAPAIYGAWCSLACYAAECPERGTLANSRGVAVPLAQIARLRMMPLAVMQRMWDWAIRPEVGWLELATDAATNPVGTQPQTQQSTGQTPANERAAAQTTAGEVACGHSSQPLGSSPAATQPTTGLRTLQTLPNKPDGRTDAGATDRPTGEDQLNKPAPVPIVLDAARWSEAAPVMKRIAKIVDPGYAERGGGRLRPADRELCWRVAALALWRFEPAWLDEVLADLAARKDPPNNRWGYFRSAMKAATERLGEPFHATLKLVSLDAAVAAEQAAKTQPRPAAATA